MFKQFSIVCIILFLLSGTSVADDFTLRIGVSNPGEIPDFHAFETDTIVPGGSGELKFTITNRYLFNEDNNMTNVSLIVNIYDYTTLETHKDVKDVSHSPKITGGNSALRAITNQWTAEFYWPIIHDNESVDVVLKIKSFTESPQGRYNVRMHLNFTFNNTYFNMKSRGYFSDELFERASENVTDEAPNPSDERFPVGMLDLNVLGVDGLIPDTTIRVLEPIPYWPLYLFIGLAILFAVLAVIFFYMDEKGKFPKTKEKLDELGSRITHFRERRK